MRHFDRRTMFSAPIFMHVRVYMYVNVMEFERAGWPVFVFCAQMTARPSRPLVWHWQAQDTAAMLRLSTHISRVTGDISLDVHLEIIYTIQDAAHFISDGRGCGRDARITASSYPSEGLAVVSRPDSEILFDLGKRRSS